MRSKQTPPRLERWLASPWRRLVLVVVSALGLVGVSASFWADVATAGMEADEQRYMIGRRLLEWAPWVLAFEPLVLLGRLTARFVKPLPLLIALHLPFAFGASFAFSALEGWLVDALLGPSPWSELREHSHAARVAFFQQLDEQGLELPPEFESRMGPPLGFGRGPREDRGPRGDRADGGERDGQRDGGDGPSWGSGRGGGPRGRFRIERGVLSYFAILGAGFAIHSFLSQRAQERRAIDLELRAGALEQRLAAAQLSNLRNQLRPHFLFNALHSVGGLIRGERGDVALTALSNLGGLLRKLLEQETRQVIPLREELELAEQYLDIERLRLGERLSVVLNVEPSLAAVPVPALLLLPLVENAIVHGIAPRPEGGELTLVVERRGESVAIEVADDGPGFPAALLADPGSGSAPESTVGTISESATGDRSGSRAGIGLANTRERLASMYGGAATFELANTDDGAAVRLVMPMNPPQSPQPEGPA